jgi:D-alanyl-D-alanine endopeptidase (penicillin-binding protein 7)
MQAMIANQPVVIVLLDSWGRLTRVADANRIRKWLEKNPGKVVTSQLRPG